MRRNDLPKQHDIPAVGRNGVHEQERSVVKDQRRLSDVEPRVELLHSDDAIGRASSLEQAAPLLLPELPMDLLTCSLLTYPGIETQEPRGPRRETWKVVYRKVHGYSHEGRLSSASVLVAVVGGTGMLGRYLCRQLFDEGHEAVALSRSSEPRIDLAHRGELGAALDQLRPTAVAHLAAETSLDRCERDPEAAWAVNGHAPAEAAEWCEANSRPLVAISTDSVFDGTKGTYGEMDEPRPLNVYATTKLLGEAEVVAAGGTVLRTTFLGTAPASLVGWLVGQLSTGASVTGYEDVRFTPLYAGDLARVICRVLADPVEGILHIGGQAPITKLDVAVAVRAALGRGHVVAGRMPDGPVHRPRDTTLDSSRAQSYLGTDLDGGWHQAIEEALAGGRTLR
jgi:dTDP-4-dehydrorhamnose reductase